MKFPNDLPLRFPVLFPKKMGNQENGGKWGEMGGKWGVSGENGGGGGMGVMGGHKGNWGEMGQQWRNNWGRFPCLFVPHFPSSSLTFPLSPPFFFASHFWACHTEVSPFSHQNKKNTPRIPHFPQIFQNCHISEIMSR